MAFDIKMEMFAVNLFHKYWYDMEDIENEPDVLKFYGDEYSRDNSYLEVLDDLFISAFYIRSHLLSSIYMLDVKIHDIKDLTSLPEICDYINYMCNRNDLFGNLTVFEKLFATTGFVISICYSIHEKCRNIDVLKYSHIFWLIYFDKFTEQFYTEGGWEYLKLIAESYELLDDMFKYLDISMLCCSKRSLRETEANFCCFKDYLFDYKNKNKQKICISKLWVMFRIQHLENHISIGSDYEMRANAWELNCLLHNLEYFCSPQLNFKVMNAEEKYYCRECIKPGRGNSFETDGFCNSIEKNFENKFKSESLISNSEMGFNVTDKAENILFDGNIGTETEMQEYGDNSIQTIKNAVSKQNLLFKQNLLSKQTVSVSQNLPNIADDEFTRKSCVNGNEKYGCKDLHSINIKAQSGKEVMDDVFCTNQKVANECIRETAPMSLCNPSDIRCLNDCTNICNETINVKEKVEVNLNSEDGLNENSKSTNTEFPNQIPELENARMSSSVIISEPKQINPVVQCVDSSSEMDRIKKAQEDLQKEQSDPEIKKFLRLILILGDKQEMESLLRTLRSNEAPSLNLRGKRNKKKR